MKQEGLNLKMDKQKNPTSAKQPTNPPHTPSTCITTPTDRILDLYTAAHMGRTVTVKPETSRLFEDTTNKIN